MAFRTASKGAILTLTLLQLACSSGEKEAPAPMRQNPSPMVEKSRAHKRIEDREFPGIRFSIAGLLPRPVVVFLPEKAAEATTLNLLVHFHGAAYVPMYAVSEASKAYALAAVHLGAGSGVYERAFADSTMFGRLVGAVRDSVRGRLGRAPTWRRLHLSAFSAGYGAVRAILRTEEGMAAVDGVLLLDGLHTDYVPAGKVLAEGGRLEASELEPFLRFARLAVQDRKKFLITHSEIFPGTYASTTETADYLIDSLGLKRTPVLKWGPLGMQQLSEVRKGQFIVLGFAGNTAPDHVDHLHALYAFLDLLSR